MAKMYNGDRLIVVVNISHRGRGSRRREDATPLGQSIYGNSMAAALAQKGQSPLGAD